MHDRPSQVADRKDQPDDESRVGEIRAQRNLAADDIKFEVQVSENLENWFTGPGNVEFVRTVINGDGTDNVTYRVASAFGTAMEKFMRVAVMLK